MAESKLEELVLNLAESVLRLKAESLYHNFQIQFLKNDLAAIGKNIGAQGKDGLTIVQSFDRAVEAAVRQRLAELSDDDPMVASMLLRIIETGQSEPME